MLLGLFSYKHVYINAINAKQIRKMIKIIIFPNGYNIIWIYSFCFLKNIFYHQVKTLSNFGVDKILLQFFYWTVRNFSYLTNWNLLKVILILLQKTFKLTWQMNLTNIILIINVIEFFFFFEKEYYRSWHINLWTHIVKLELLLTSFNHMAPNFI